MNLDKVARDLIWADYQRLPEGVLIHLLASDLDLICTASQYREIVMKMPVEDLHCHIASVIDSNEILDVLLEFGCEVYSGNIN